ncbi:FG-GAP-like repeat-containing protein [Sorangium sp. So ce117]|uniref:FG-GAP-like repeat-containing protein n=1 Tax=Sorangium sp. So ce117 TaxID=3133277 RepID=UPI003F5D9A88
MKRGRWVVAAALICSCDGTSVAPGGAPSAGAARASNESILGFEDAGAWTLDGGAAQASDQRAHGEKSLEVPGGGYHELVSAPLSTLAAVHSTLSMSLSLPEAPPGAEPLGRVHLVVELPSRGIERRFLQEVALPRGAAGQFTRVDFDLPAELVAALRTEYDDLRLKIALDLPRGATGPCRLDAIRLGATDEAPRLRVAEDYARSSAKGDIVAQGTFTLRGRVEDNTLARSVSVSIGDAPAQASALTPAGEFAIDLPLRNDPGEFLTPNRVHLVATDIDGNESASDIVVVSLASMVPGELIVKFSSGTSAEERGRVLSGVQGALARQITPDMGVVTVPKGTEREALSALLAGGEPVRLALPNLIAVPTYAPNDTYYHTQNWYIEAMNVDAAWDIQRGSHDVVVAVVDSGVIYYQAAYYGTDNCSGPGPHPLVDNIYLNADECCAAPPCSSDCMPLTTGGTCPRSDLNSDGCPGGCGVDDDGDGATDLLDPDVARIYTNDLDDDGDGSIADEIGPGGVACNALPPGALLGAPEGQDCDGAARDDDENGYPDDCRGFQFARPGQDLGGSPLRPNDPSPVDTGNTHGDIVAGALGEIGDDCAGYTGVMHRVKIMPLGNGRLETRIVNGTPTTVAAPTYDAILEAYQYAARNGAHVVNSSFAGSFNSWTGISYTPEDALHDLTEAVWDLGVSHLLFVTAAGNWGTNLDAVDSFGNPLVADFPAHLGLPNKIVVAASDQSGNRSVWTGGQSSAYGAKTVSVAAPGTNTFLGANGTSLAAPMVSGVAGLLLSQHSELRGDPVRVVKMIEQTAAPLPAFAGLTRTGGIVDAHAALTAPLPPQPLFTDGTVGRVPLGTTTATSDIDLIDIDNDGDLDVFIVPYSVALMQPRLLRNDGGHLVDVTALQFPSVLVTHTDVDSGDVDGDGDMDIIAAAHSATGTTASKQAALYLNSGGTFTVATTGRLPSTTMSDRAVELCDVDADGDLDAFFGNVSPGNSTLLINGGNGVFTDQSSFWFGTSTQGVTVEKALCVDLADVNASACAGRPAALCGICSDPKRSVAGLVASGAVTPAQQADCLAIRQAIYPELILAGTTTMFLRNTQGGPFINASGRLGASLPLTTFGSVDVEAADLDTDGDLDLVFAPAGGAQIVLLSNNGTGYFVNVTASRISAHAYDAHAREVELGDFDMDGDVDIVMLRGNIPSMVSRKHSLYRNAGGYFDQIDVPWLTQTLLLTADGDVGDMDGDGDLDLMLGNYSQANQLLLNTTVP